MRSATERTRAGFALMEAVIALAIIGMVSIGLLAATANQVRTADKATLLLHARALAEDRLALLRALDYYSLADLPDSLAAGVFEPPFGAFAWTATVAPVRDEYDLFSVEVAVTVAEEAFVLRTLLHEPDPQQTAVSR